MTSVTKLSVVKNHLQEMADSLHPGDAIIIELDRQPFARLMLFDKPQRKRKAGREQGAGWISEDFDEPLPDDFWTGTE